MTIRRGEDWGVPGRLATEAPIAATDAELGDLIAGTDCREAGLIGGDLARTVGATATSSELRTGERVRLPIDIGVATIDGEPVVFVAHLIVRQRFWLGPVVAVMNAAFLGEWNVAPRGHPNDGRLDVVSAQLRLGDRVKARSRLRSGTHVPHPDIRVERRSSGEITPPRGAAVFVDGVRRGRASMVTYSLRADAMTIVI